MTLHEAIQKVLIEQARPMTSREIADVINAKKYYSRGDGKPLPTGQITARINKYQNLFTKNGKNIELARVSSNRIEQPGLGKLGISNFKGFGEKLQNIDLKPITLIFGENSSGKSSILHSLLYQNESIRSGELDIKSTKLAGDIVDLGGIRNLSHGKRIPASITKKLELEIEKDNPYDIIIKDEKMKFGVEYNISLSALQSSGTDSQSNIQTSVPLLSSFIYTINNVELATIVWNTSRSIYQLASINIFNDLLENMFGKEFYGQNDKDEFFEKLGNCILERLDDREIDIRGLFPRLKDNQYDNDLHLINSIFDHTLNKISIMCHRELHRLRYIGPFREYPDRHFSSDSHREDSDWTARGGDCWDMLVDRRSIRDRVNAWLKEKSSICSNYSWKVYPRLGPDLIRKILYEKFLHNADGGNMSEEATMILNEDEYEDWVNALDSDFANSNAGSNELRLYDDELNITVSHKEVGVGISQMMPIIVNAIANSGKNIMIEEPEIHIHPKLQAELGDLFVESSRMRNNHFIIETHSEHLILRLLKIIRNGGIEIDGKMIPFTNKDLSVVSVIKKDGESKVVPIRISKDGEFLDPWPGGFFETGYEERFG